MNISALTESEQGTIKTIEYHVTQTIARKGEEAGASMLIGFILKEPTRRYALEVLTNGDIFKTPQLCKATKIIIDSLTGVDEATIESIKHIPYHVSGGSIDTYSILLRQRIGTAHIGTLLRVCLEFLHQKDSYWNDNRERDFSRISEAIHSRARKLGYRFESDVPRYYMNSISKRLFLIPDPLSIQHLQ